MTVVLVLAFTALVTDKAPWIPHTENTVRASTRVMKEQLKNPLTQRIRLQVSPPMIELPDKELGLSFRVSQADGDVFISLINHTDHPISFYNSMKIDSSMFPSATKIEVRDQEGRPFAFKLGDDTFLDHWTPLYLTSRAFLNSERKLQTLESGAGFSKIVPLENFFGGANFDFNAQSFQARIHSRIYLDASFQQYIEAASDWFDLPKDLEDIPPPADC